MAKLFGNLQLVMIVGLIVAIVVMFAFAASTPAPNGFVDW